MVGWPCFRVFLSQQQFCWTALLCTVMPLIPHTACLLDPMTFTFLHSGPRTWRNPDMSSPGTHLLCRNLLTHKPLFDLSLQFCFLSSATSPPSHFPGFPSFFQIFLLFSIQFCTTWPVMSWTFPLCLPFSLSFPAAPMAGGSDAGHRAVTLLATPAPVLLEKIIYLQTDVA